MAVLRQEAGFEEYLRAIANAGEIYISAVNLLECYIVLAATSERVGRFIRDGEITVKDFTQATSSIARLAFLQYGKGRHRAALNICDCAAYATAKEYNLPLLYKGNDFAHTDVKSAI
ncbi:MAG: type II toxin-antitoxin system VapC family toxin [Acidobacteriota bacterium]|nr:type II toxin-antitoxin system VapC family toxin [Acidobacteriota bacterium]